MSKWWRENIHFQQTNKTSISYALALHMNIYIIWEDYLKRDGTLIAVAVEFYQFNQKLET